MKWFAETTDYRDNTPNGVYLLDDGKSKMYAFRPFGTGAIKVFKNPIRIDVGTSVNSASLLLAITNPRWSPVQI